MLQLWLSLSHLGSTGSHSSQEWDWEDPRDRRDSGFPVSGAPTSQGLWILPDYSGRLGLLDRAVLLHVVLSLFPRPVGWTSFLIPKACKAAASFLLL